MGGVESEPLPRTSAPVLQRVSGRVVGYEDARTRGRQDKDGTTLANFSLHKDGTITGTLGEVPIGGRFTSEGMMAFHKENTPFVKGQVMFGKDGTFTFSGETKFHNDYCAFWVKFD